MCIIYADIKFCILQSKFPLHKPVRCLFVLLISFRVRIFSFKLVAPKRKRLEAAEVELSVIVKHLNTKRAELNAILSKFQALNDDFSSKSTKKEVC